jgi:hypothetical protein
MTSARSVQPLADEHVFLIGRPPLGEFLGFVKVNAVDPSAIDLGALTAEWRSANDHIRQLEADEAGAADNLTIGALSQPLARRAHDVLNDPVIQRGFAVVPIEIGVVELDRLVVYQKHINLAYVQALKERLGPHPTDEAIFDFCLPRGQAGPAVRAAQISQDAFQFMSPSTDLRLMDSVIFRPDQVTNYTPNGAMSGVVALVVGYGVNLLSIIAAEGRGILSNGSHRAFALRDMGIAHVPCIVQRVSRREELMVIASEDVRGQPDIFLSASRPPVLKDYFDPALRKLVQVPRKVRQVRLVFKPEVLDVPAA